VLKKTITYEDLNGDNVNEDHYFHLSKAELIELELSHEGGFDKHLKRIVDSKNGAEIVSEMKKLILMSYGQKSEDGKRFIKSQELIDEFTQTEAWSTLFMEIATEAGKAVEFVRGVMPSGMEEALDKLGVVDAELPAEPEDTRPDWVKENRLPTKKEIGAMSKEELQAAMAAKLQQSSE
jgi:hypothetical protein